MSIDNLQRVGKELICSITNVRRTSLPLISSICLMAIASLVCSVASVAAALPACNPEAEKNRADEDGYGQVPGKTYCEGFIGKPHSAQIQVLSFQTRGIVASSTKSLKLLVPSNLASKDRIIRISGVSSALGSSYKFDVTLDGAAEAELDLARLVRKRQIPLESLSFIARYAGPYGEVLIPTEVRDAATPSPRGRPVLAVRIVGSPTSVHYRVASKGVTGDWKEAELPVSGDIRRFVIEKDFSGLVSFELKVGIQNGQPLLTAFDLEVP